MPKAGGTSFKFFLKENFRDQLYLDYTDYPDHLNEKQINDKLKKYNNCFYNLKPYYFNLKNKSIFHGHFLAAKYKCYLAKENACFITWLRDPIERLVSHYYYWLKTYNKERSLALHKRVVEEKWSLEKFCFSKEMKNLYSKFLIDFDIKNFDFIGIVEKYDEDFIYFNNFISKIKNPTLPDLNKTVKPEKNHFDNDIKGQLKQFHKKDYEIYDYALRMRKKRINSYE
ncbi:sulfotransferase family 2 domain-containing protein [Psychroflexus tropicus]|uniref:sulfotransferase family 2 domain-containing protein n=1 Tax=Psychroflexus tropicus TaxID=197345 RepID=UPI001461361C